MQTRYPPPVLQTLLPYKIAAQTSLCKQDTRLLYFKPFYPTIAPNSQQYLKEKQVSHSEKWEHIAPVLENENVATNELHNKRTAPIL